MITFLVIILAIGLLILAVIMKQPVMTPGKGGRRIGSVDREFVARKWAEIEMKAGANSLVAAVSEADKLLDYALKQSGVPGKTMGERLKNSKGRFSNLNAIWSAHKLRNALAHEAHFDLVPNQAKEALQDFKRGLTDLGAL
jgi:hypothetical protein